MAFYALSNFDEEEMQQQKAELDKGIEEIENMTEEEKQKKIISWEEVKKKFFDGPKDRDWHLN